MDAERRLIDTHTSARISGKATVVVVRDVGHVDGGYEAPRNRHPARTIVGINSPHHRDIAQWSRLHRAGRVRQKGSVAASLAGALKAGVQHASHSAHHHAPESTQRSAGAIIPPMLRSDEQHRAIEPRGVVEQLDYRCRNRRNPPDRWVRWRRSPACPTRGRQPGGVPPAKSTLRPFAPPLTLQGSISTIRGGWRRSRSSGRFIRRGAGRRRPTGRAAASVGVAVEAGSPRR